MITQRQWMDLDPKVRSDISKLFAIKRSGASEVIHMGTETQVKSDGVLERDLEAVMPQILSYLDVPEEPINVLSLIQEKMYEPRTSEPVVGTLIPGTVAGTQEVKPRRRGRPPGKKAIVPPVA